MRLLPPKNSIKKAGGFEIINFTSTKNYQQKRIGHLREDDRERKRRKRTAFGEEAGESVQELQSLSSLYPK
jgi:hypothetical protein